MSDDAGTPADTDVSGISDSFTETTTQSWFSRMAGAILAPLLGLLLLVGSVIGLSWNEHRAIRAARSLAEGGAALVSVTPDRIDPANQGKLVHVSGKLTVPGTLTDPEFGLTAAGAAQLRRVIEIYQWREETRSHSESHAGGSKTTTTTYDYTRGWSDHPIDSSRFHHPEGHRNPPPRYPARAFVAPSGELGAFRLTGDQLRLLEGAQNLPLVHLPDGMGLTLQNGAAYFGADPSSPRVGDERISFEVVKPAAASIIAQQSGTGFAPYQTHAGNTLMLVSAGTVPAGEMIRSAEQSEIVLTWVIRVAGTVAIFIAFLCFTAPLVVLADILPILGTIAGAGATLVASVLTCITAPLVIALAWIAVRPTVAAAVLVSGAALAFALSRIAQARRTRRPALNGT